MTHRTGTRAAVAGVSSALAIMFVGGIAITDGRAGQRVDHGAARSWSHASRRCRPSLIEMVGS